MCSRYYVDSDSIDIAEIYNAVNEWQKSGSSKKKYIFTSPENPTLYMAGCFRAEHDSPLPTFVILTRDATELIQTIHYRMPVIAPEQY